MIAPAFRSRFKKPDLLFGVFVKMPDLMVVETLAEAGVDFIVFDQEHAPFDRRALDTLLFAARALDLPALVRVPNTDATTILAALDSGATGVLLPHIVDAADARRAADACRYGSGRGYSGAVRSTRNRGALAAAIKAVDREIIVVAQIEDAVAIDKADEIAASAGIDALFIGRGDLAVSLRAESAGAPEVWSATETIARGADRHRKPLWAFASNWSEADQLVAIGAQAIILGSDQSHLKSSAAALVAEAAARNQRLMQKTDKKDRGE